MILQKILNPISSKLVDYKYRDKLNPFVEFNRIKGNHKLSPITKENVLIGSIRMNGVGQLFEGMLAYSLRMKGYKVYALMCGQGLEHCETKDLKLKSNYKCSICYKEQNFFCDTFGVEPLYINDLINNKERETIEQSCSKMSIESMLNPNGIDLEPEITSGLMRVLKVSNVKSENYLTDLKKYGKTSMLTYQATLNIFKTIHIDQVVMSHGVYSTWGAMIKACNHSGIDTAVWGRGYVGKGNILATHRKSYLFENIVEPTSNYIDYELTEAERKKKLDYIKSKRNPNSKVDYVSYYDKEEKGILNLNEEFKIPLGKKVFGMFPNIPWDGQLFSASESYPNIGEFAKSTIEWFVLNPDNYLIIRAHPAELAARSKNQMETFKDILFKMYPKLPENVKFLNSDSKITSYQLEEQIDVALLYAGTIALEFTMNKTPVIQLGKNFSSNKGFVFEPLNNSEYHGLLDGFSNSKLSLTDEMFENGLKYIHHWVYKRHIPETIIKLKGQLIFDGFFFTSMDELNENKTLNWFIDKLESKEDFVYDLD